MKQTIGIIDYGYAGNIYNIKKAIEYIDKEIKVIVIHAPEDIKGIDKLILPGVGTYRDVMKEISCMREAIKECARHKTVLGICIGMHILSEKGYEFGETEGFGFLKGEVMRMPVKCRVPHIGWAPIEKVGDSRILKGVTPEDSFYYMHSYEFINYTDVVGLSAYCGHNYVSAVEKENIFGIQFHPEKSRVSGFKILDNFARV
jgi:imidazole glycerol phosphate synthase glutamine amidotransferase subunit